MAHIPLPEGLPGIRGPFAFRPETSRPLCELAEILLHAPGTLTPGERELIATYVSSGNSDNHSGKSSHGAIAARHLGDNEQIVLDVKHDFVARRRAANRASLFDRRWFSPSMG